MAGKVVNSNFLLLSKFVASPQESSSKAAIVHTRKTQVTNLKSNQNVIDTKTDP